MKEPRTWHKKKRIMKLLTTLAEQVAKNGAVIPDDDSEMLFLALIWPTENNLRNAEWELGIDQPPFESSDEDFPETLRQHCELHDFTESVRTGA
jgi:hypothetical protein